MSKDGIVQLVDKYDVLSKMGKLNQIAQTKSINFALLERTGENEYSYFHPPCKCRDYLSDILHSYYYEKSFSQYGMTLSAEEIKLNPDELQLAVEFPSGAMRDVFLQNFDFVNRKGDQYFGVAPSYVLQTNKPKSVIIIGDKFWQSKSYLLSLFTFLCRCCTYLKSPDEDWDVFESVPEGIDKSYYTYLKAVNFEKFIPLLKNVAEKLDSSPSGFDSAEDILYVHGYSGILSIMGANIGTFCADRGNTDAKEFLKMATPAGYRVGGHY